MNNKFLFMLGLCRKAGKLIIGTDLVTKSLPSKKTYLVIYTCDASGNTEKKITDKCKDCKMCMKLGCPAITIKEGKVVIDVSQCNGCGLCVNVCPFGAIEKEDN